MKDVLGFLGSVLDRFQMRTASRRLLMNRAKMQVFGLLALILGLSAFGSAAYAEFTTIAGWDRQLFPSYAAATATLRTDEDAEADETELGDPRGLLGVVIDSPADDATVKVTIEC